MIFSFLSVSQYMSYMSDRSSSNRAGCSLSRNVMLVMCSLPSSRLFRKSIIRGLDTSCPKILLKPISVKGLMNLAISISLYIIFAKVMFFLNILCIGEQDVTGDQFP